MLMTVFCCCGLVPTHRQWTFDCSTSYNCAKKSTRNSLSKSSYFEEQTSAISLHHLRWSRGAVFDEDCWANRYIQSYLLYATSNKSTIPGTALKLVLAWFFWFALLLDHLRRFSLFSSRFEVCCLICCLLARTGFQQCSLHARRQALFRVSDPILAHTRIKVDSQI